MEWAATLSREALYRDCGFEPYEKFVEDRGSAGVSLIRMRKYLSFLVPVLRAGTHSFSALHLLPGRTAEQCDQVKSLTSQGRGQGEGNPRHKMHRSRRRAVRPGDNILLELF